MGTQRKEAAYEGRHPAGGPLLARVVLTLTVGGLVRGDHSRWIPHVLEPLDETFWTRFDAKERR
jgi:hypothetical protein